jgi:hypothetical protein
LAQCAFLGVSFASQMERSPAMKVHISPLAQSRSAPQILAQLVMSARVPGPQVWHRPLMQASTAKSHPYGVGEAASHGAFIGVRRGLTEASVEAVPTSSSVVDDVTAAGLLHATNRSRIAAAPVAVTGFAAVGFRSRLSCISAQAYATPVGLRAAKARGQTQAIG